MILSGLHVCRDVPNRLCGKRFSLSHGHLAHVLRSQIYPKSVVVGGHFLGTAQDSRVHVGTAGYDALDVRLMRNSLSLLCFWPTSAA